jgi:hypothetical protein
LSHRGGGPAREPVAYFPPSGGSSEDGLGTETVGNDGSVT